MSESNIDKELIRKYLTGSANDGEKALVRHFLQRPGSRELFDIVWKEMHPDMESTPMDKVANPLRMERWKSELHQRIAQEEIPETEIAARRPLIWRYAAVWALLILGATAWGILEFGKQQRAMEIEWISFSNPYGQRARIQLPDSSTVYLGAGSTLNYPRYFRGSNREVQLQGEAFFDVAKDKRKPFIVQSGDFITQVLGTSFKIEAFADRPVIVVVSSGKVRVERAIEDENGKVLAELIAGQQLTCDLTKNDIEMSMVLPSSIDSWKEGKLTFNELTLNEISNTLERNYNIRIHIKNTDLLSRRIRITLEKNLPLGKAMDVLAASGGFSYKIDGNHIEIY